MDTHEVLVAARNLIDRNGWVQNDWGDEGGPRCALGAISEGKGVDVRDPLLFEAAQTALAEAAHVSANCDRVIDWNNDPARTEEEVLAAFDKAIAATAPAPDFDSLEVPQEVAA